MYTYSGLCIYFDICIYVCIYIVKYIYHLPSSKTYDIWLIPCGNLTWLAGRSASQQVIQKCRTIHFYVRLPESNCCSHWNHIWNFPELIQNGRSSCWKSNLSFTININSEWFVHMDSSGRKPHVPWIYWDECFSTLWTTSTANRSGDGL